MTKTIVLNDIAKAVIEMFRWLPYFLLALSYGSTFEVLMSGDSGASWAVKSTLVCWGLFLTSLLIFFGLTKMMPVAGRGVGENNVQ